ncbi:DNA-binding protein [Luteimonas terrae]|uniref:DNA-binding protein n=1 Tax=Luteimonas terrae TaxID=1530191 RepID=A0A4R5U8X6_9GAMM|nr:DNA-binding protein [Luteimonas terrae]TDK30950.1 DNA-binding protein [Luteimonas terrae]
MPYTLEQVKAAFEASGMSVATWADARGFTRAAVYAVLDGRTKGRRGEAHRIATALGIKESAQRDLEVLLACEQAPKAQSEENKR